MADKTQLEIEEERQVEATESASKASEKLGELMSELSEVLDDVVLLGNRQDNVRALRDNLGKAVDALMAELKDAERPMVPKMVQA